MGDLCLEMNEIMISSLFLIVFICQPVVESSTEQMIGPLCKYAMPYSTSDKIMQLICGE